MPLFRCETPTCHAVDNTACVDSYWARKMARTQLRIHGHTGPWRPEDGTALIVCSECETGVWHGRFEKRTYDPAIDPPLLGDGPQIANPRENEVYRHSTEQDRARAAKLRHKNRRRR